MFGFAVGDLFPGANILGVDLSPIQPDWVPPGVKFMVDDVESSWVRPMDYYDYIHGRHTVMAIKDWPRLMSRVFEYVILPSPLSYADVDVTSIDTSNQAAGSNSKKSITAHNPTTPLSPQPIPRYNSGTSPQPPCPTSASI